MNGCTTERATFSSQATERPEDQTEEEASHYPYSGSELIPKEAVLAYTKMQSDVFSYLNSVSFFDGDIFLPFKD